MKASSCLGWSLLTAGGILVAGAAALVIRAPRPDYTGAKCQFDPVLGWAPAQDPSQAGSTHRVGQWQEEVDDDREHIVIIGDSVAYGTGVSHPETYAAILGGMVSDYQVLNLSVTGYSIDQYFLALERELPKLHPRLVLVNIFTGNDYQGTTTDNNYGYSKPLFVPDGNGLRLTNVPLSSSNCVYFFSRSLLFSFLWRWAVREEKGFPRGSSRRETVTRLIATVCGSKVLNAEDGRTVIERLLDRIVALASEQGAEAAFVLLPDGSDFVNPESFRRPPFPKLQFFRELMRRSPYRYLDLSKVLSRLAKCEPGDGRACEASFENLVYLDGSHYTPYGHRFVADALYAFIEETFGIH